MRAYKNQCEIWIYCILIVSSILPALFVVQHIKISPDSMRFGLVSQQILSGNGISVPIMRLEDNYVPVNGAIPFLDQMPLIPIIFAILGGVTSQNYMPAQALNLICHVTIALFTFLLMKNIYNKGMALLTGFLVSFSYPLLLNANRISSEPLFIALVVATIYFILLSRHKSGLYLLIAGICASAAILTRNAGIALIPVFFWEVFLLLRNKRQDTKYTVNILSVMLPVITTMSMFVRNYVISGNLRGYNQASPARSFTSALMGTIETIYQQFLLDKKYFILVTFILTACIIYILINAQLRKGITKHLRGGLDLVFVFQISYTALIVITMAKQAWRYELRYVSPLVPFLFITCVFLIIFVLEYLKDQGWIRVSFIGIILSLGILTGGNLYKTCLSLPDFTYRQEKAYSILNSCTFKWMNANYQGGNMIIATNRPFHLSFFGGYSTIALPHKRFDETINIPDDMESFLPNRMSKFGSRLLVLFEEAEEKYEGRYVAKLFNDRKADERFTLVHECSDGVVYILGH